MSAASADRNLLYGIHALLNSFITRDALIAAMTAWVLNKDRPLADLLVEQKALRPEHRALLDGLIAAQLQENDNDAARCLASVSSIASARADLERLADADLSRSLGHVGAARRDGDADPWATRAPATVGQPSSVGQRFRILRPHAEGGLGRVSVAADAELHREVELKEIKDKFADHPESRARFLLEAEITGGLEHPGVVP